MRLDGRRLLIAVLMPAALLLLACGSARPTVPSPAPDFTRCADLGGAFLFEDLARSCRVDGSLGVLPVYPIKSGERLRGPRDRKDFLPLPQAHWADPGSALTIDQASCSKIGLSLREAASSTSYLEYELDLAELAGRGTLNLNEARLSFEGPAKWEGWQLPLGSSRLQESWSMARDEQGRLRYSYSLSETSAVFWVIPWQRRLEVTCALPPRP